MSKNIGRGIRRLVRTFSFDELRTRVERGNLRKVQEELDTHKLFLYTRLWDTIQHGSLDNKVVESLGAGILQEAQALTHDQRVKSVQATLRAQILDTARVLHSVTASSTAAPSFSWERAEVSGKLSSAGKGKKAKPSGLAYALSTTLPSDERTEVSQMTPEKRPQPLNLSFDNVRHALHQHSGFSLCVQPSTVQHDSAGNGLFLLGQARPGAVVALFPGLVYPPLYHKYMPDYPKVDLDNPYLIARYDGLVIDSKPWTKPWGNEGATPLRHQQGGLGPLPFLTRVGRRLSRWVGDPHLEELRYKKELQAVQEETKRRVLDSMGLSGKSQGAVKPTGLPDKGFPGGDNEVLSSDGAPPEATSNVKSLPFSSSDWLLLTSPSACYLQLLDPRHPLALAHLANHPGKGMTPNTMVASFTLKLNSSGGDLADWRRFLPNITFEEPLIRFQAPGGDMGVPRDDVILDHVLNQEVRGIALVATHPIEDGEEIFFNYRMSPGLWRPSWYHPVDEVEEDRRWA